MKTVFLISLLTVSTLYPFFTAQPTKTDIAINGSAAAFVGVCSGGAAALLLPVSNHYPVLQRYPSASYAALLVVLIASHYQMTKKVFGDQYADFATWIASGTLAITAFLVMVRGE